ncbi:hypothetical protein T484DRAFT_1756749 [Baffinella frigidus]|nr:hypothetical protein T484DRAFT_1756749 [Cryptophyta sp. CCMP2293]
MSFFDHLSRTSIKRPDVAINNTGGSLLPAHLQGIRFSSSRVNQQAELLSNVSPYQYGQGSVSDDITYQVIPHKVQKIVPQFYLPSALLTRENDNVLLSHGIDNGDLAFTIRMASCVHDSDARAGFFSKQRISTAAHPIINLPTLNYIIRGLQTVTLADPNGPNWESFLRSTGWPIDTKTFNLSDFHGGRTQHRNISMFIQDYIRPLGVVIGSNKQGGQHQGGGSVDAPVDFVVTILVDGMCESMINLWRRTEIRAGDDLLLVLGGVAMRNFDQNFNGSSRYDPSVKKGPMKNQFSLKSEGLGINANMYTGPVVETEYVLNHWVQGSVQAQFSSAPHILYELIPTTSSEIDEGHFLGDDTRNRGLWHIARSQVQTRGASVGMSRGIQTFRNDNANLMVGAGLLHCTVAPVWKSAAAKKRHSGPKQSIVHTSSHELKPTHAAPLIHGGHAVTPPVHTVHGIIHAVTPIIVIPPVHTVHGTIHTVTPHGTEQPPVFVNTSVMSEGATCGSLLQSTSMQDLVSILSVGIRTSATVTATTVPGTTVPGTPQASVELMQLLGLQTLMLESVESWSQFVRDIQNDSSGQSKDLVVEKMMHTMQAYGEKTIHFYDKFEKFTYTDIVCAQEYDNFLVWLKPQHRSTLLATTVGGGSEFGYSSHVFNVYSYCSAWVFAYTKHSNQSLMKKMLGEEIYETIRTSPTSENIADCIIGIASKFIHLHVPMSLFNGTDNQHILNIEREIQFEVAQKKRKQTQHDTIHTVCDIDTLVRNIVRCYSIRLVSPTVEITKGWNQYLDTEVSLDDMRIRSLQKVIEFLHVQEQGVESMKDMLQMFVIRSNVNTVPYKVDMGMLYNCESIEYRCLLTDDEKTVLISTDGWATFLGLLHAYGINTLDSLTVDHEMFRRDDFIAQVLQVLHLDIMFLTRIASDIHDELSDRVVADIPQDIILSKKDEMQRVQNVEIEAQKTLEKAKWDSVREDTKEKHLAKERLLVCSQSQDPSNKGLRKSFYEMRGTNRPPNTMFSLYECDTNVVNTNGIVDIPFDAYCVGLSPVRLKSLYSRTKKGLMELNGGQIGVLEFLITNKEVFTPNQIIDNCKDYRYSESTFMTALEGLRGKQGCIVELINGKDPVAFGGFNEITCNAGPNASMWLKMMQNNEATTGCDKVLKFPPNMAGDFMEKCICMYISCLDEVVNEIGLYKKMQLKLEHGDKDVNWSEVERGVDLGPTFDWHVVNAYDIKHIRSLWGSAIEDLESLKADLTNAAAFFTEEKMERDVLKEQERLEESQRQVTAPPSVFDLDSALLVSPATLSFGRQVSSHATTASGVSGQKRKPTMEYEQPPTDAAQDDSYSPPTSSKQRTL